QGGGPNMDAQCTPIKKIALDQANTVLRASRDKLNDAQRTYENQVSPYLTYPAGWTTSMAKTDASLPSCEWAADGEPRDFPVGTQGRDGADPAQGVGKDGGKPCGKCIYGSFQVARQCSRDPYGRAYLDSIPADGAADTATAPRIELATQIE